MRLSALLFLTFFYLCPVRAQIDSICLVNHGPISVLSSKGFWDPKYGVAYPTFSIPLYNRYKQISYSLSTIEVRYRGNDSLFIVFPLSRSKAIVSSEIKEYKVRTVEREDFFVEGVSRKTMDRRYRNRMLLYLKGENARGEALFNRNPHKQSFKILEPLMGTMHAYSILQDSSFFEVIKGTEVDTLFDKGPYYVNDTLQRNAMYQLPIPKGWKRIAYSTGEIIILYPKGELIMVMPSFQEDELNWGEGPFCAEHKTFYESGNIPFPIRSTLRKDERAFSISGHYGRGKITVFIRSRNEGIGSFLETHWCPEQ